MVGADRMVVHRRNDRLRLSAQTFVRHAGDESVVWCPRTGGCTVMRDARAILDEVALEWRGRGEIMQSVAERFGCAAAEVAEGVDAVLGELAAQGFVETDADGRCAAGDTDAAGRAGGTVRGNAPTANPADSEADADGGDESPLVGFCRRHGLPIELHIDLTDACNERCVHCYLPKGGVHFLDPALAFKVLDEFRAVQGLTVTLSGGECLLHRDFAAILRHARELGLNVIVLSNLTLCDAETVELLKEVDPQFVNVSLYAVDEAVHDSITQIPGSCAKSKAAIDALAAAGVHVRIQTPFMYGNRGCVAELKAYAAERRIHLVADCDIFGGTDQTCANRRHALSPEEMEALVSANCDAFPRSPLPPEACGRGAKVCGIGDDKLNLDAEGRYYPCDGFHGAILGDARTDSLSDVWTGDALNRLRALKNADFGPCASCADRAWCKVCPMRNFNETGDMLVPAPWRCEATRLFRRIFGEVN